jgi:hypothetical protein
LAIARPFFPPHIKQHQHIKSGPTAAHSCLSRPTQTLEPGAGQMKLPGVSPDGSDKPKSSIPGRQETAHLSRFREDHKGRICGCGIDVTAVVYSSLMGILRSKSAENP